MKIQISQEEKEVYKENSDFFNRKRRRCIKIIKTQPLLRKNGTALSCLFVGLFQKKKRRWSRVTISGRTWWEYGEEGIYGEGVVGGAGATRG
jgi:hypothetical protein